MLNLFLFKNQFTEIFDNSLDSEDKYLIVCSSPVKADTYRESINRLGLADQVETITIAKFLTDQLVLTDEEKKVSKSELLSDLWTFWKSSVDLDYEKFHFSFELFTEIRSYDLSGKLLEELADFDTLEKDCISALMKFNSYVENFGIVDEQGSYQRVAKSFVNKDSKKYIFTGFDHLNGNQIDMLNAMAKEAEVTIPIHEKLYSLADKKIYWPNWIEDSHSKQEKVIEEMEVDYHSIPQGRVAEYLDEIISDQDNLIYFSKNMDLMQVNSTLRANPRFKTDFSLFDTRLNLVLNKVQGCFNLRSGSMESEELLCLLNEWSKKSLSDKDMVTFKVQISLINEIKKFVEKSTRNEVLYNADLKLLKEVMSLNLPRTSIVNLSCEGGSAVGVLDDLKLSTQSEGKYLFITREGMNVFGGSARFSNDVLEAFSAFGPMQSSTLELLEVKVALRHFVKNGGKLIIEEGAVHGSNVADTLFEKIELNAITSSPSYRASSVSLDLVEAHIPEKVSPSFLQTYIDCPRKWYFKYAERVDLGVSSSAFIDKRYVGTINHSVIESYFELYDDYSSVSLKKLIVDVVRKFITDNNLRPNRVDIENLKLQVEGYCSNIIRILMDIKKTPGLQILFEYDISKISESYKGFADLVIINDDKYYIYDFKTSETATPKKGEIESFSKIQLLAYFETFMEEMNVEGGGYICLENIDKSIFIGEEDFFSSHVTKRINKVGDIDFNEFKSFIDNTTKTIASDKEFIPSPKSKSICTFCVAGPVCAKGMEV